MGSKHGAGKGDRYRQVDQKKYAENWEKAFGKKKSKKDKQNERNQDSKNDKR